jgi:hypothetical protein
MVEYLPCEFVLDEDNSRFKKASSISRQWDVYRWWFDRPR